jgi:hypothetical protein
MSTRNTRAQAQKRKRNSGDESDVDVPAAKSAKDRKGMKKVGRGKKGDGGGDGGRKGPKRKATEETITDTVEPPDLDNTTSGEFKHLGRYIAAAIRNPANEPLDRKLRILEKVGRGLERLNGWSSERAAQLTASIAEEKARKAGKGKGKGKKTKKVEDSEPSDDDVSSGESRAFSPIVFIPDASLVAMCCWALSPEYTFHPDFFVANCFTFVANTGVDSLSVGHGLYRRLRRDVGWGRRGGIRDFGYVRRRIDHSHNFFGNCGLSVWLKNVNKYSVKIDDDRDKRQRDALNLDISNVGDLPTAILRAAEAGRGYIPFSFLTRRFLDSPHASQTTYTHGALGNPHVTSADEHSLTFADWLTASRKYLDIVQEFSPKMYKKWLKHYQENYYGGAINEANWTFMLEYDIDLRRNARPSTGTTPDMQYTNLRQRVDERVRVMEKEELKALARGGKGAGYTSSSSRPPPAQYTQQTNYPERFFGGAGGYVPQKPIENAGAPYLPISSTAVVNALAIHPERLQIKDAPHSTRLFCFACGSNEHMAKTCNATQQANGKPIVAKRAGPKRSWFLSNGDRFCYNWNGLNGCSEAGDCKLGLHVCSRCEFRGHSARACQ